MKVIFALFFLGLYMVTSQAAEMPPEEGDNPPVAPSNKEPIEEKKEEHEWQEALMNPESAISPTQLSAEEAEFQQIIKIAASSPTIDNIPLELFLREQTLWESLRVSSGFMLKSMSQIAAKAYNYFPFNVNFLLKNVSSSALYSYANQVTRGDIDNFPPIALDYVFQLVDGVEDRQSFAKLYLNKRSFSFEAGGFNGFGKGYKGYAIFKDFAWGQRLVAPGEEPIEIAKNPGKSPVDNLVTLKEHITPNAWLAKHFVRTSPMVLRKIGTLYKDSFGNTCLLYELVAEPECMIFEVMRKPEGEFENTVALWKVAWSCAHEATAIPSD